MDKTEAIEMALQYLGNCLKYNKPDGDLSWLDFDDEDDNKHQMSPPLFEVNAERSSDEEDWQIFITFCSQDFFVYRGERDFVEEVAYVSLGMSPQEPQEQN